MSDAPNDSGLYDIPVRLFGRSLSRRDALKLGGSAAAAAFLAACGTSNSGTSASSGGAGERSLW